MASKVQIGNLTLSYLGQAGTLTSIDPPDGSAYADVIARFYGPVRTICMSKADWSFATKRSPVLVDTTSDIAHWAYRYALPSDVLTPISLLSSETTSDDDVNDFLIEGGYIYANIEQPVLRYVYDNDNPTTYSAPFVEAFARQLAAATAGTIQRGIDPRLLKTLEDNAEVKMFEAKSHDALKVRQTAPTHKPSWIAAR